jgi:hypothetical protein
VNVNVTPARAPHMYTLMAEHLTKSLFLTRTRLEPRRWHGFLARCVSAGSLGTYSFVSLMVMTRE